MSREIKRLAYLSVLLFLAAFALSVFVPQDVTAGKRPAEPSWGVKIIDYGNLAGMAPDHIYKGSDPNVRVTLQKSTSGGVVTGSTLHFFIYANPQQTYATFHDINFPQEDLIFGDPGPVGFCGFPGPPISEPCLVDFVNSWHPKPGYVHLLFYFVIGADLENEAIFPLSTPVQWTGTGAVTTYFWNAFDPIVPNDPESYASVTASLKNLCIENGKGIWITRMGPDTWEIEIRQQVFDWTQFYSYATTSIGRNGRTYTTITNYQPLAAKGELTYKIVLIKNPA